MTSLSRPAGVSADDFVTLSLQKFSFATTQSLRGKLLWTHVAQSNNNLFAIIDHVTYKNNEDLIVRKKIFKVLHGEAMIVSKRSYQVLEQMTSGTYYVSNTSD